MVTLQEFRIRLDVVEAILWDMEYMVPTGDVLIDTSANTIIFNLKELVRDLQYKIDRLAEVEQDE